MILKRSENLIYWAFWGELRFSAERQVLFTLWGGSGHNITYASKAHIELKKSGLFIGGFTQPDRMMEIIEEMKANSDILFSSMVYKFSPVAQDYFNDIKDRVRIREAEVSEPIIVEMMKMKVMMKKQPGSP